MRFTPTSMTTAPGFTMSPVTNSGLPIATMRMSACRVTALMSRVREWHTVTVALQHPLGRDVLGERQLHQDPVDLVVRVEALDEGKQLGLGRLRGESQGLVVQAGLVAGLALHADIGVRGRVFAHQHGSEPGGDA